VVIHPTQNAKNGPGLDLLAQDEIGTGILEANQFLANHRLRRSLKAILMRIPGPKKISIIALTMKISG
jgi:hypothetical protein